MGRRKGELTLLMEVASKWQWKMSAALVTISFMACHLIARAFVQSRIESGIRGGVRRVGRGISHEQTVNARWARKRDVVSPSGLHPIPST
jgi:hypothetical protein